jgi:hypothetical protein
MNKFTSFFVLTFISLRGGKGIPTIKIPLDILSGKSIPSLNLPLMTPKKIAPLLSASFLYFYNY